MAKGDSLAAKNAGQSSLETSRRSACRSELYEPLCMESGRSFPWCFKDLASHPAERWDFKAEQSLAGLAVEPSMPEIGGGELGERPGGTSRT